PRGDTLGPRAPDFARRPGSGPRDGTIALLRPARGRSSRDAPRTTRRQVVAAAHREHDALIRPEPSRPAIALPGRAAHRAQRAGCAPPADAWKTHGRPKVRASPPRVVAELQRDVGGESAGPPALFRFA